VTTPPIELPVAAVLAATAGAEREVLETMLEYYRAAVKRKAVGVSEEDLRRRFVPSQTTLGGIVKHLAVVERRWFERALQELPLDIPPQEGWALDPGDTITSLLADYDAACARSREIAAGLQLDDTVPEPELGRLSLRWVYVHMIDETARHAGHADIIRELIDGATGDR
jgi:Protein of unknown function (DUF664)